MVCHGCFTHRTHLAAAIDIVQNVTAGYVNSSVAIDISLVTAAKHVIANLCVSNGTFNIHFGFVLDKSGLTAAKHIANHISGSDINHRVEAGSELFLVQVLCHHLTTAAGTIHITSIA